jgi:hypothetical protein
VSTVSLPADASSSAAANCKLVRAYCKLYRVRGRLRLFR